MLQLFPYCGWCAIENCLQCHCSLTVITTFISQHFTHPINTTNSLNGDISDSQVDANSLRKVGLFEQGEGAVSQEFCLLSL